MDIRINIKNVNVNSISTIGSLNIGKAIFLNNRSHSYQLPKDFYQESEFTDEEIQKMLKQLPPYSHIPHQSHIKDK